MITVEEAIEAILQEIRPLGLESVGIHDALGRALGEDVAAQRSNPPWDNSAMDGYALRSADVAGASKDAPASLKVVYDLPAGGVPKAAVGPGEAVRIMTGAPVPPGADAVVMVEETEAGNGTVAIKKAARPGENIRRSGEDFRAGDIVLKKGAVIRAAEVAMLATVGAPCVFVHKRPRVAVISTGDELAEIERTPGAGKISNSNGHALAALVAEAGATPVQLGIARDTKESLKERLEAARSCDCIISSGGVSVGDYDFVKDVLAEMGSRMLFWKVAMKPGKPLAFGVIAGVPAFGLPGNPISSMVAFEQFVRPAILKMSGHNAIVRARLDARLLAEVKIKPGRTNFLRGLLKIEAEGLTVAPLEGQGSGIISTMVASNCFIVVPKDSAGFKRDAAVKVQPFDPSVFLKEYGG
ncbi:MAG: molybdopterin molybdotransferase MoeA [Deltaproteobacteria bacterium]|nr:molybdopterin molybdotransferase MoeA [Deltaproteobacteria bacterium]